MAAHARARPRPVHRSVGNIRRAGRDWRRSRPFLGALIAITGGTEILFVSLSPTVHGTRTVVPVGVLIAGGILACALLLLFDPAQRSVYATAAVLLAISALTTSHLGGYLVGTMLGAAGGAVAFAWVPRVRGGRQVRIPIPGFTLIRGEGGLTTGPGRLPGGPGPDMAAVRPAPPMDRSDLG